MIKLLLATAALAIATTAAATPLVLSGNYLQVGISDAGTFGSNGNTSPGILHDPTGTATFGVNDYLTPGTPHDGFGVTSSGGWRQNDNDTAGGDFGSASPTLLVGAAALGFANAATWSGTDGNVNITNSYFFNNNDQRIRIITTITALSDLTNVAFARSTDPDPDVNTFGSFVTNNQRGNTLFGVDDFIGAAGPQTGLTLGLLNLSGNTYAHTTQINFSCCSNIDPYDVLAHAGDDAGLLATGDYGLNLAYSLGDLKAGQTVSLSYAYVFGNNIGTVGDDVPEPASWAMMIAGFGLIGAAARRRRTGLAVA
jgi:hypothetical protein